MLLKMYYIVLCAIDSLIPQNLESQVHCTSQYGKCKMVDLVVINYQAYFLHIYIIIL